MFRIKHEPDAMDLTHRPEHLLSPTMEDDDEHFSHEEDTHDCIPKVGRLITTFHSLHRLHF